MHGRPLRILLALSVALAPLSASSQERFYFRNVQGSASGQTNPNPNPNPANPASISVQATVNAQVGVPVNVVPTVSNLDAPVAWSISGALPGELALSASTGAITGTALASGTFDVVLRAQNATRFAEAPVRFVVTNPAPNPPVIGAYQSSFEFFEGEAFTIPAPGVTGGTPPYTYSIAPSGSPFSFSTSTGAVSWANPVAGSYPNNVVSVVGGNSSNPFSITVRAPLVAGSYAPRTSGAYQAFNIAPPSVTGGTPPYSFSGSLPAGMTLLGNGGITGTINVPGSYAGTVTVSDSSSPPRSTTSAFSVSITAPGELSLSLSGSIPAEAMVGVPVSSVSAIVDGGVSPYSYALAGAAPAGVELSGSSLGGTPSVAGTFTYGISVTDSQSPGQTRSSTGTTIVYPAFTASLSGSVSSAVNTGEAIAPVTIVAAGGKGPYTYAGTGLPDGVTVTSEGVLQGAPTAPGTYNISLTATESFASQVRTLGPYTMTVSTPQSLVISTSTALPTEAMVGQAIAPVTFQHTGGTGAVTYETIGSLPPGITLSGNTLSGTPEVGSGGSYSFFVQGSDSASQPQTDLVQVSLTVYDVFVPAPDVAPQTSVTIGSPITTVTVNATGGKTPYIFGLVGSLPTGVTFSNAGVLSGTPQQLGTFNYRLTASHSYPGAPVLQTPQYTLTVNDTPALSFAPQTPPANATTGSLIALAMNPTGGRSPYNYSIVGTAPPELQFSGNQLSGTPSTNGDYAFQIRVTDSTPGTQKSQISPTYNMQVRGPVAVTTSALTLATATVPYNMQVAATGGNGTYTFSATGLPSPLTMSTAGLITGTPSSTGIFPVQITATDSGGRASQPAALSLSVQGAPVAVVPRPTTVSAAVVLAGQGNWAGSPQNAPDVFYDSSNTTGVNATAGNQGGGMPRQNALMTWSTAHKGNCAIVGVNNRASNFTMMVRFRFNGTVRSTIELPYPSGLSTSTFISNAAANTDINEVELLVGSVHTDYLAHTFKVGAWDGTTCITAP